MQPFDVSAPLASGPLLRLKRGALVVDVAPQAGGRIAQITHDGVATLVGPGEGDDTPLAWGSYPMVPWAGRIRHGRFHFDGREVALPITLGAHAIHGVALAVPWQVDAHSAQQIVMSLQLPQDASWPFGGCCVQHISLDERGMLMQLQVSAGAQAMQAAFGWHPWLRKPDDLVFAPQAMYPRDAEGIATLPLASPHPPPWDDCFVHRGDIEVLRGGMRLRLSSDCDHWVVYDEPAHATCIEPQTGPPDAFTIAPSRIEAFASQSAWFRWEWLPR